MKQSSMIFLIVGVLCCLIAATASADVSSKKAIDIAKDNLNKLVDQTYHYRLDYDSVFVIPVHSKVIWKNDFYLVYFLNNNFFEAEVEVDAKTGDAALLAMKKMAQPYYEVHTGEFNYRYFNADSVAVIMHKRHSIYVDSARMVYFGVIPKLGKRGAIWEVLSNTEPRYQSLSGASLTYEQIAREINASQRAAGNFTADEIRMDEINAELKRLGELTPDQRKELKLSDEKYAEYREKLESEKKDILMRFTELGSKERQKK